MHVLLFILLAQAARVSNAKVESRSGANLEATFQTIVAGQETPAWIAYSVPAAPGNLDSCYPANGSRGGGKVMLEGATTLVVLFRVAHRAVEKIRPIPGQCEIDAGGLPVIELTDVRPSESVALLRSLVPPVGDQAMAALALQAEPAAVMALLDLAKSGTTGKIRGQALFWVAQKAGQREMAAIAGAIETDPDIEVKKKAVFALTQIPNGEGVTQLIKVARTNRAPEVRKQAMFWLGQSKDARAVAFFEEVLGK
jgi:hypothetical protein